MKNFWNRHHKTVYLVILLLALVPFLVISLYARPASDDYAYSYLVHDAWENGGGLFSIIKAAADTDSLFYNTWQGLYVSAFILSLQPGVFGGKLYFLGTWALIAIMFLCLRFFVKTLLDTLKLKSSPGLIALALLIFFLQGLPSTHEGLYWFNGAWNYMPFFFLLLTDAALMLRYLGAEGKRAVRLAITAAVAAFLVSGGNHITAFLNILVLLTMGIFGMIRRKKLSLLPCAAAVFGFLLVMIAPGTAVRAESIGSSSASLTETVIMSAYRCYLDVCSNIGIHWVLGILLLTPVVPPIALQLETRPKLHPVFAALWCAAIYCASLCVPYMAMGDFGEGRVDNVRWMLFFLLTGGLWVYTLVWLSTGRERKPLLNDGQRSVLILALLLGICLQREANGLKTLMELRAGTPQAHAEAADARVAEVEAAEEGTVLEFDPLPYSWNLSGGDLTDDSSDGHNTAWKQYYGIDAVVIK